MISTPGPLELIFLLGLALLVLGPNRLPEAARAAGRAIREMRDALSGDDKDDEDEFASRDEEELADAGPAAEASYREAVAGDNDAANGQGGEAVAGGNDAAEPPSTEKPADRRRGADTEAGDPAPPPVS